MPIACIADTVHVYSLANRLNDQRKDGSFCDVLLKVSGQILPTHSSVLSASSPYFRGLICGDRPTPPHLTSSSAPQEIELELLGVVGPLVVGHEGGGGLEAIAGLVDYIYTGKINLREDCVDLVAQLAEAFMLDGLLSLVKAYASESSKSKPTTRGGSATSQLSALSAPKPSRSNRVITLPVRVNRKVPPVKLRVGLRTKPSIQQQKPRVLRSRKRDSAALATLTTAPATVVTPTDEEEVDEATEDDDWTLPKKERKQAAVSTGPAAKKKRKRYRFRCKQCDFVSLDLKAIRDHKLVHPNRTFECVACSFITGRSAKLLEHVMAADHAETKCSLCGSEAANPAALREHLRRHDDPKPFFCDCCDQRFTSPSLLALHVTKHTTDRPFVCPTCHHAFKLKNNLRKHQLTHTAEKTHICDQCDFRTAYKGTLRMHLRIHSGEMLACPHQGCNFQAYSKRHITKHGLTHNKDKPYVCEVCGQKYAQIESLRRHSKVHNPDTKILSCELCQYSTTRTDKMREHSKKSHNGPGQAGGVEGGSRSRKPRNPEHHPPRADGRATKKSLVFAEPTQQQQPEPASRMDNFQTKKMNNFMVDHQPPRMDSYHGESRWDPPALLDPRAHHFPHHRDQATLLTFMATHSGLL